MRALLTAFGPFCGRSANQSQSVLEQCLRRMPPAWRAELLPVDLAWVRELAAQRAADPELSVWLALGEAGVEGQARLELFARNHYDLRDDPQSAAGEELQGALLDGAPAQLAATLPCGELGAALRARGHALGLSQDAGAHCCNALLYCALRAASARPRPPQIAFLHLPRRPEEAAQQARLVLDALAWCDAARAG